MNISCLLRKTLLIAFFVSLLGGFGSSVYANKILLFSEFDSSGMNAVKGDLIANGDEVTVVLNPDSSWSGSNPPLDGFDVVIHLSGVGYYTVLPLTAQIALVEFVNNGGGYVGTQWSGYELWSGYYHEMMRDLILHSYGLESYGDITYTIVPGQESHPVLSGIPNSFIFVSEGGDNSPTIYSENQPLALMTATSNGSENGVGLLVREVGQGRVVSFGFVPDNYYQYYYESFTLIDPNIRKLILNAAMWAGGGGAIEVSIDIKPGSDINSINLGSKGGVPVAILGSADFDAAQVDPYSVTLGGATVKVRGKGVAMAALEDVNGDGILDAVVHVSTETFELTDDTVAELTGKTYDGKDFKGTDLIRIVP